MGQKVHPTSFRLGVIRDWNSRWFASKADFGNLLLEDANIRKMIENEMTSAFISRVDIERATRRVRVKIYSGRPGMIIGRKGAQIEKLRESIQDIVGSDNKLYIDIKEIPNPSLDAKIIANNIAFQLKKRIAFRRVMKKTIQAVKDAGGEGVKLRCSGRLGGAEIARSESYKYGKVPLQTIRADIDYAFTEARTTYGVIGVKVWLYKGEKMKRELVSEEEVVKGKGEKRHGADAKKS